ncbi:MAG: hypothetical protein K1X92_13760 [Bacteroidia bacterium]|nr:hypothetical protein [Bacteroidia bacterium]
MDKIVSEIRKLYGQSAKNEKKLQEIEALMVNFERENPSTPVIKAYRASVVMIKARFLILPHKKYACFLEGKKQLEEVLESHPDEIEIRFIRLSVQRNLPPFLGYNHLSQDKAWLEANKDRILTSDLMQMIANFWKQEGWGDFI